MARKVARKKGKVYKKSRKELGEKVCHKSSKKLGKSVQKRQQESREER